MANIFKAIDILIKNNTYIALRLWVTNTYQTQIVKLINEHYNCQIDLSKQNFKINKYLYVKQFHEFIWPNLNNNYYNEVGDCYALRDHIGILSDGTIIPCCLDTKGIINLGNIYTDSMETILNSQRVITMQRNFTQHKKCEELCKHCSFLE